MAKQVASPTPVKRPGGSKGNRVTGPSKASQVSDATMRRKRGK